MKNIDLRSDTVTVPTPEMYEAMTTAKLGDDVYGDDPTVRELEEYSAELLGKEAALFVPSGTFGNQLAIFTHCERGDEVILGEDCHIVAYEVGAAAVIAGVQLRALPTFKGQMEPAAVEARIRGENIHYPKTGLICLENAYSNGRVVSVEYMQRIFAIAQKHNIPVHLDGARIFNAALSLGVEAKELAVYADSVMFCLAKGLCTPVGSILAGTRDFITAARKKRKLMGGGMRQVGVLAAPGLVALKKMIPHLAEDHKKAKLLGAELAKIPGIKVFSEDIQINMVFIDISATGYDPDLLVSELYKKGIKVNGANNGIMRFVTNYWVSRDDIYYVVNCLKEILASSSQYDKS